MRRYFALLGALILGAVSARAAEAVFIVNPSVSETSLSADDVKSILLGSKNKWASGNLKLVVQTAGPVHDEVLQTYTQRSAEQFDKFWKKQVFTGKANPPVTAKSDAEVVAYVAGNAGAFGYVAKSAVNADVKVVTVP